MNVPYIKKKVECSPQKSFFSEMIYYIINPHRLLSNLHSLGHPSHRATKPLINTRFVWHVMNIDIAIWCRSCKGCQTAKVSRHNTPVFGKFTEPTERFDHVHIDIVGPLPYTNGFRYLLTCVDRFTRWRKPYLL